MQRGTASGEEILCVPLHLAPSCSMLEEKTLPLETHTQHPEVKPDLVIAVGENSILFL